MASKQKFRSSAGPIAAIALVLFIAAIPISGINGNISAALFLIGAILLIVSLIRLIVDISKAKKQVNPESTPVPDVIETPKPAPITVEQKPAVKAAKTIERVHVRWVDKYAKNVESVAIENDEYNLTKKELAEDYLDERVYKYSFFVKAALVPEPDNEYDPNAIMVQADGLCVGYVPRGSTAHIRKLMESGRIEYLDLKIGGGAYKEVYETDDDKYELDKGELAYSAVLEIHLTDE